MMRQSSSPLIPSVLLVILVNFPTVTPVQERCSNATQNSDTGGSCTFDNGWCGWRNQEDNDLDWREATSGEITHLSVSMSWVAAGSQAKLISPMLCATGSELHSFRFRYFLDKTDRCRLSLYLLVSGTGTGTSSQLLWTSTRGSPDSFLSVDPLSFRCPDRHFQIMFVGEKLSNRYQSCGRYYNEIDVDNVVYNNTRVIEFSSNVDECPAVPSTSPITATTTTTTTTTTRTTTAVTKTSATSVTTTKSGPPGISSGTSATGDKHAEKGEDEGGLSSGAVAGIVVVVVVIVIIIVIVVVFLFVRRKKRGGWRWKGSLPTVVKIRRSVTHRTHYMLGAQRNHEIATHENHHHLQRRQEPNPDISAEPSTPPSPPQPPSAPSSPVYINLPTTTTTTEASPSSPSHSPATNHHHHHPHHQHLQAAAAAAAAAAAEARRKGHLVPRYDPVYDHQPPVSSSAGAHDGNDSRSRCLDAAGQGPAPPDEAVQYANCGDQPDDTGGSEEEEEGQLYNKLREVSGRRRVGDGVPSSAMGGGIAGEAGGGGDTRTYNHLGDDVHNHDRKEQSQPLEISTTGDGGYTSPIKRPKTGRGKNSGGGGGEERSREGDYANEETYANEREGEHANEYANCSNEDSCSLAKPVSPKKEEEEARTGEGSYYYNSPRERPSAESAATDCEYSLAQHVRHVNGDDREASEAEHYYNPNSATQQTASDNDTQYSLAHHFHGKGKKTSASGHSETADIDSSENVYSLAQHVTPNVIGDTARNDDVNHGDVSNDFARVQRSSPLKSKTEQTRENGSGDYVNVEKSPRKPTVGESSKGDSYNRLDLKQRNSAGDSDSSEAVGYYNVGGKGDRYDHLKLQERPSQQGCAGDSVYCNVKGSDLSPC